MSRKYKHWNTEKRLIPKMIKIYCKGNHKAKRKQDGVKRNDVCDECKDLTEYALYRLEKCPFKENKNFCSYCSVHCYNPCKREEIKLVMRYAGPRMIFTHPIFAFSHVVAMIKHKKQVKANDKKLKESEQENIVNNKEKTSTEENFANDR